MSNYTSHVLLVDDNTAEIYPLVEALRKLPYRVTVAGDGIQAYALAVSTIPDIIVMDVRMPRRDGIATTRLLKANSLTGHIPVLFLTAAATLADRLEGLRSGAVDYMLKPFDAEEVVERVRIHLSLVQKPHASSTSAAMAQPGLTEKAGKKGDSAQVLQRAAASIIQERLADPPQVSELAALLGVSERRIMAAFKSSTGMSVFEYVRRERMHRAARLLTQTNLSMLDIVAEVGYSSAANFSTAFRQYWGKSPSSYRDDNLDVV